MRAEPRVPVTSQIAAVESTVEAVAPPKVITNSIGMTLVLIPAGGFLMGSPDSDEDARADEKPPHGVRITRPFYLGATEVTQGQYRAVTGENPSHSQGSDDLPVDNVSWVDAQAFCARLNDLEHERLSGMRYRLPTEAEWEYACRAGSATRFAFGNADASLGDYAWFSGNSNVRTHSVGQKGANAWGLFDMHGNVWEWCWDAYDEEYYVRSPADDPRGADSTGSAVRVIRGGCWRSLPRLCRAAGRDRDAPGGRGSDVGFRVA
jgi:formylglycine-generating enzyme required for sulfatase activity